MTVGEQIADELYGLHCDIGRLEVENAKLREENQSIGLAAYELGRKSMAGENAKLQEQVERLHADQAHWELDNCPSCPNVADLQEALAENAKLRELATYALKHIIEFECEEPDRERLRGKPCEDCADYGSSDCPKCMPRMFGVSGIEVD